MTLRDVLLPLLALATGCVITAVVTRRRRLAAEAPSARATILLPFAGTALSERALQAALRLASAEEGVVVPAYLATVPLARTLDAPVGRSCDAAFPVFEAIDQRAAKVGVPVDGRVVRGRNVRHALRVLMEQVPSASRVVVAGDGFGVDDVDWLLRHARGEVLVVRPDPAA